MFNHKAAEWARDLVMKMDPDEAAVLVPMVMSDVLYNDIQANRRTVNNFIATAHGNMLSAAERIVSKSGASEAALAAVITDGMNALCVEDDTVPFNIAKYSTEWGFRDASGKFSPNDGLTGKKRQKEVKHGRDRFADYSNTYVGQNRAAMDLVSSLERNKDSASRLGQAATGVETHMPAFQQQWASAARGTNGSSTTETYRRIHAGSQALSAAGAITGSQHAAVAGAMGQFAGQYGPEAEKIIGPSMRRAAYRYRGVERKIDDELATRVKQSAMRYTQQTITGPAGDPIPNVVSDDDKRRASRYGVLSYMNTRIPTMRLSEIQRKSGRVTPSEGVVISPKGEIGAQSFGHADDHYLPFNLKNLGKLKGGEYVRTRTTGGLTSEDIYTGLMSGAKRVTVVSNSGVFSVEFEDDLTGIRRYGDKAHSMVGRYQKTLDTIRNGKLERVSVTPDVKAELLAEAENEMPPSVFNRNEIQGLYREKVEEYKNTPTLTNGEMAEIDNLAKERAGDNDKEYRLRRATMIDDAMEAKAQRIYRLDGDGYSTALDAMKEQYPYFIKKVTYSSKNELSTDGDGRLTDPEKKAEYKDMVGGRYTGSEDKGYVKPKHNRPEQVLEGFYDSSINGQGDVRMPGSEEMSGKTRGDRTDFQNWRFNPLNPDSAAPKTVEGESPAGKEKAGPVVPRTSAARAQSAGEWTAKNNAEAVTHAVRAIDQIPPDVVKDASRYPLLSSLPQTPLERREAMAEMVKDPAKRKMLADEFDMVTVGVPGSDITTTINQSARSLRSSIPPQNSWSGNDLDGVRQSAVAAAAGVVGFSDLGHQPGASPEEIAVARKNAEQKAQYLKQYFGEDADKALKFAGALATDPASAQAMDLGLEGGVKNRLMGEIRKNPEAVLRSAEGYARLKHLSWMHGEGASSPKALGTMSPSASETRPTASIGRPTLSTSSGEPTGAKQIAAEQPRQISAPAQKETFDDVLKDLDRMVGHEDIKREVRTMANFLEVQSARKDAGLPTEDIGGHMVFLGNPGTGKTTVARMIGRLYASAGLLPSGHVVEVGRSGLVGEYTGQTAPKVRDAVDEAIGGVLFIDEAYTLAKDSYGQEAIEELMTRMENDRGKFVVIAAGYDKNMGSFLASNPGLESRFNSKINFSDYSPDELKAIFTGMAKKDGYVLTDKAADQMAADLGHLHANRGDNFANGRTVRQYWENAKREHANRLVRLEHERLLDEQEDYKPSREELETIEQDDLSRIAPIPKKKPVLKPVG